MSDEEKRPTAEPGESGQPDQVGDGEQAAAAEELQGLLEDARSKADQHWEQVLRLQAELENTRRRSERDLENAHKYALERFATELLPVKDSLELGLSAAEGEDPAVAKLREGVELTLKMLAGAMEKFGIREVDPAGEPFDPQLHQAMTMQESAEHKPNTVLAVMQKGYLLHDRLVRPAMVVVSREPSRESGSTIDEKA